MKKNFYILFTINPTPTQEAFLNMGQILRGDFFNLRGKDFKKIWTQLKWKFIFLGSEY